MKEQNNPAGASEGQRKQINKLIQDGLLSGTDEGICLLTYDQAQKLIENHRKKPLQTEKEPDRLEFKDGCLFSQYDF